MNFERNFFYSLKYAKVLNKKKKIRERTNINDYKHILKVYRLLKKYRTNELVDIERNERKRKNEDKKLQRLFTV